MKVLVTSDTHCQYDYTTSHYLDKFFQDVKKEDPDIFVHAGDVGTISAQNRYVFFYELRKYFPTKP